MVAGTAGNQSAEGEKRPLWCYRAAYCPRASPVRVGFRPCFDAPPRDPVRPLCAASRAVRRASVGSASQKQAALQRHSLDMAAAAAAGATPLLPMLEGGEDPGGDDGPPPLPSSQVFSLSCQYFSCPLLEPQVLAPPPPFPELSCRGAVSRCCTPPYQRMDRPCRHAPCRLWDESSRCRQHFPCKPPALQQEPCTTEPPGFGSLKQQRSSLLLYHRPVLSRFQSACVCVQASLHNANQQHWHNTPDAATKAARMQEVPSTCLRGQMLVYIPKPWPHVAPGPLSRQTRDLLMHQRILLMRDRRGIPV